MVDWCVMTAFLTLPNTSLLLLLHILLLLFSRVCISIYMWLNILTCNPLRNILSNPFIPGSSINVITVPSKIWRKNAINKYDPILYDDVDEDLYVFKSFDKSMTRTPHFVPRPRSDLILWYKTIDQPKLQWNLHTRKIIFNTSNSLFLISFMITGIPSAKEVSRDRNLILNSVLTRVIHPPFVVGNQFMVSIRVK